MFESPFHFPLHITPVVQGHLPGTGTRGTGRVNQQANWLCELWSSRQPQDGMIAVLACAYLYRFHFILVY
jgi:hypothetical protein